MGYDCFGGLGLVEKAVYFLKQYKIQKRAKQSLVDACITHCPKLVRFNNSQQKVLPFLFKDFLLFSGRVESRDNICVIEHDLIDRNHACMYLAKSHLSTAYVLRDRPPPITFLLNHWGPMP